MRRKIGIGISDFRKLRESNALFIDKSLFIQEVLQTGAEILLIPRPRRFGKTLNISMLREFFEVKEGGKDFLERTRRLFSGLNIEKTTEFNDHFARYPVIFLTFKDVKELDFEKSYKKIVSLLTDEIDRHLVKIAGHPHIRQRKLSILNALTEGRGEYPDYQDVLRLLSEALHEAYGAPAVILIDEYDTPIHASWQYGYYEEMVSFMRGILSGGLKDNPHIYKGVITGVLRVARESIFSDLNNLDVYTILDEQFSDKFGITEEELAWILKEYGLNDRYDEINEWYNGYSFGSNTIFNPWSILNFIDKAPCRPEPYWANTSSNALIKELIIEGGLEIRERVEKLIAGQTIESAIDKNIVFPELRQNEEAIFSLLFFSGYLKCVKQRFERERLVCLLSAPNREVGYIFKNIISRWLNSAFHNRKLTTMLKAIVSGDIETFQRLLNEFVITTLSFFDAKGRNPEAVYQAFVLGMLLNLGQDYEINSNRELGYGRYDILILPKKDRLKPAVILEMKSIAGFYKDEPEKAMDEALKQIERRAYAKELNNRGFSKIIKVAVVSDGKKVWVKRV